MPYAVTTALVGHDGTAVAVCCYPYSNRRLCSGPLVESGLVVHVVIVMTLPCDVMYYPLANPLSETEHNTPRNTGGRQQRHGQALATR